LQPHKHLGLLTLSIALATFMEVLDTSIANVAVPTIAGDLAVSATQGTWVISSYSVSSAIAVPLTGWLAKRFGEVRLFLLSVLGFTVMSALCGLARNIEMLIIGRLLQGLLSGPMVPLSQSILLRNYPPQSQGLALGLWSMTIVVAPILGPLLGGWITDNYHWSWIFLINLPIGVFCVGSCKILLKNQETEKVHLPIDTVGLTLLVIGVGSLQLMLDNGYDLDWFNSNVILLLGISAVICLGFFVTWTLYEPNPIVNLQLFKNRNFTVGVLTQTLGFMTFFSSVVIFPLWLQTVMGYPSNWAGFATAPMGVFALILSPIIGRNIQRVDLRIICTFAFFVLAFVSFWSTTFTLNSSFIQLISPRIMQGIGISCFFIPLSTMIMGSIPVTQIAQGASLSNFLRVLSGAIGTTLSTTLWNHRATFHHVVLSESLKSSNPAFVKYIGVLHDLGFTEKQTNFYLENLITTQSYMLATNDIFFLSGILFLSLLFIIWFAKPITVKAPVNVH